MDDLEMKFYLKDGTETDIEGFIATVEANPGYPLVADDYIGDIRVSTRWNGQGGISCMIGGPPMIFETMIFKRSVVPDDEPFVAFYDLLCAQSHGAFPPEWMFAEPIGDCRYATLEQAEQGHQKAVQAVQEGKYG